MIALLALAAATTSLLPFEGHWRCEGRFIASGKTIRSELRMDADPQSGVFIVHHDDTAPMAYHSVETWIADPNASSIHAAVSDRFSGLRVFQSPGIVAGALTFSRPEGASTQEEFRYVMKSDNTLEIDWSVARSGQPLRLGDTLTCERIAT